MDTVLTTEMRKARKDHPCNACDWLTLLYCFASNAAYDLDLTEEEARTLSKAEWNGWKVKAGDNYIFASGKYNGEMYSSHSIPEVHEICEKYGIYDF